MDIHYIIFGRLTREFLLPATGQPRLDMPGGSLLYAAAGLGVWESGVGLVGRVGNDYPRAWLNDVKSRGFDTTGVRILSQDMDVREFIAYNESLDANRVNPVSHFARREMTFPKSLLGYQPDKKMDDEIKLTVKDIPEDYLNAHAAYLCPMDLVTQTQLIAGLKRGHVHSFILDPSPDFDDPGIAPEITRSAQWRDGIPSIGGGDTQSLSKRNARPVGDGGSGLLVWLRIRCDQTRQAWTVAFQRGHKGEMGNPCIHGAY